MTEKEGGSDVGKLTTTAVQDGDHWRLSGEKWFCSNCRRGSGDAAGAGRRARRRHPRRRAVLMPRRLEDGRKTDYRIVRLKDKLGTARWRRARSSWKARLPMRVGKLDRGFVQMPSTGELVAAPNGVKSTALMRRAYHDSAMTVARNRVVFGSRIIDLPLARGN